LKTLISSRRLWPLTLAQAGGAVNDNLVKNALVVLALFRLHAGATGLSALAGALFIAPYVLLSASAGTLADRFAKPRLILCYKLAEVALMAAAAVAFLTASVPGLLAVLVGLGIQAALFGPVKYGVLPEYLTEAELLGGNAVIEATTFLSIVCGTVAGGGLILLANGVMLVAATGVGLSLLGLYGAARMPPLPAANPALRLTPNIPRETWTVIRAARARRPVWFSLLALSWFWTMGATVLTELPVLARDILHARGSVLTLFLAVFAIGVGLGSFGCTILLRGRISARLAPPAAIGISLFCWAFAHAAATASGFGTAWDLAASAAGWWLLATLLLLAACGGVFSVPLYAIIQEAASADSRSRMVAANNIMNAVFMVLGAAAAAGLAAAGLDASETLIAAAAANLAVTGWIITAVRGGQF
jgi:acyl-[acyl-carrier-protein]-phospholipid O-acyltransferase/long-chain-fatty-acid--[acyl-carrier-protein] ligase